MGKRVLVVDDQAVLREGLRRLLANEGHYVETFAGGLRAVERMQEVPFDLVITDLKMPGMSGIEVVRSLKILQPHVPIIIISGFSSCDSVIDAMEAMKSGAAAYVAKPFTSEEILEKIRECLEGEMCVGARSSLEWEGSANGWRAGDLLHGRLP